MEAFLAGVLFGFLFAKWRPSSSCAGGFAQDNPPRVTRIRADHIIKEE